MSSGEETGSGAKDYECCKFRGSLSALDAKTGKVIWKTFTIPDPPKQYKTTADGRKMFGPAGASLWSAPIIDEKRKRIYIGSGNSYTGIELNTTDAILAFDLETGSLLWSNQVTPGDNWVPGCPRGPLCPENPGDDYDFGSSTLLRNVGGRDVILASQKSGVVYALDPEQRGKVIWKTRIGVGNGLLGGIGWGMAAEGQTVYAAIADINKPDGTPGTLRTEDRYGRKDSGARRPRRTQAIGRNRRRFRRCRGSRSRRRSEDTCERIRQRMERSCGISTPSSRSPTP